VPQITSVQPNGPQSVNGTSYTLTGTNLEMIEKVGWDALTGTDVSGMPVPLQGPGQQQTLAAILPAPPTKDAPLYLWLRGERIGRATSITVTPHPSSAALGTGHF
jgi:hypothetical protein